MTKKQTASKSCIFRHFDVAQGARRSLRQTSAILFVNRNMTVGFHCNRETVAFQACTPTYNLGCYMLRLWKHKQQIVYENANIGSRNMRSDGPISGICLFPDNRISSYQPVLHVFACQMKNIREIRQILQMERTTKSLRKPNAHLKNRAAVKCPEMMMGKQRQGHK